VSNGGARCYSVSRQIVHSGQMHQDCLLFHVFDFVFLYKYILYWSDCELQLSVVVVS